MTGDNRWNNQHNTPEGRELDLEFLTPVALTTSGIIIKGYEPHHSKYLIIWSTTGSQQLLGHKTCEVIDQQLHYNEMFPEDLFTL
jgi:hypothetical protein